MVSCNRRQFISQSIGICGLAVTGRAAALACGSNFATDSGPFYPAEDIPERSNLVRLAGRVESARGQLLALGGVVVDAACKPVSGVYVEIWQADSQGNYRHPRSVDSDRLDSNFGYFGKVRTQSDGAYAFTTVMPSSYKFAGLIRAAHIHFRVRHPSYQDYVTEVYFAGDQDDLLRDQDRVFQSRPQNSRAQLIVSLQQAIADNAIACRFDLALTAK